MYPGTRWLIYLAMGFVIFQLEGWLVLSFRSHVSVLWWRMMIEASMMLAAILPGFVMARIEDRPSATSACPLGAPLGEISGWGRCGDRVAERPDAGVARRGRLSFGALVLHGARIWKLPRFTPCFFCSRDSLKIS